MVTYVPLGVSSPGLPVLIGQVSISFPSRNSFRRCAAVLATTISDRPIEKSCVSVCVPHSPGPAFTPSRCAANLTLVCAGQ